MYYVTMTDKFLSGWGHAEGRISKYILQCDTYEEALVVEENARARSDMKHINIVDKIPYYPSSKYHIKIVNKEEASRWYQKGAFK